jgi:hypothetical protein
MASASIPDDAFTKQVDDAKDKASIGAVGWSIAYHGSGIFSILASAGAAFLAAAKLIALSVAQPVLIAALSGIAATLTAVSSFTGCQRKWRINRSTRMNLRLLKLEWGQTDPDRLRDRFAQIMREHERGIVTADAE